VLAGNKEATVNSQVDGKIIHILVKKGESVKEGQVVVEFPTNNPDLEYAKLKASFENSEKTYKKLKAQLEDGQTTQAKFDAAEAQYQVNKENFELVKQMLFVESPISGTITEMLIREGEQVEIDKPLFSVAQLNKMKASIWVTETEAASLSTGMAVSVYYNETEYPGKISYLSSSMDDQTKAYGVEIQVPNPLKKLKSGESVDIRIKIYANPSAILLPKNLIQHENDKDYVYIANNGKAEKRYIETGEEEEDTLEIKSGLNPGDKVITSSQQPVAENKKVEVIK
jgi:RND family efflux transporter MFP subunit